MILAILCGVIASMEACFIVGGWVLIREQGQNLHDKAMENDILRQEIRVLNDSIARAARVPIIRNDPNKVLEKSDTYFEGQTIVKITGK